jgi:capsular polysaccharide biosynthesis protein
MSEPEYRYDHKDEFILMDFLNVIWKQKWLIIIPTFFLVVLVGIYSFLQTPVWQVESIIQPAKFTIQTEGGDLQEVLVTSPKQIASQIKEGIYNRLIVAELNLDIREFPEFDVGNLNDTSLIRVITKDPDTEKAKFIHLSLFKHLKAELDRKVDVEMRNVETQIEAKNNSIQHNNLIINDNLNHIKLKQIQKNKIKQQIITAQNKLTISKQRFDNITEETKTVKERLDAIETQQRKALAEKYQEGNALSLLLYSNEIQHNLRYYNTLDEKLSNEKITQENLNLFIHEKEEELNQMDTEIENLKNDINKIENIIEGIQSQIQLLKDKKARIDYAQLIKEPTSSLNPVAPRKKFNIIIAGLAGLFIFAIMAFLIGYVQEQKTASRQQAEKD